MIDLVFDADVNQAGFVSLPDIEKAVLAACGQAGFSGQPELCLRVVADAEIQALNKQWRGKDKITDVLSFPMQDGPDYNLNMPLGDIVLAAPFVHQQAGLLGLPVQDHVLHLIIHAVLHLLGFDHGLEKEAKTMQQLEQNIMSELGLHDPYPGHVTASSA